MKFSFQGPILSDGSAAYIQWLPSQPWSLDAYPDNTKIMISHNGNWNWSPYSSNEAKVLCEYPGII